MAKGLRLAYRSPTGFSFHERDTPMKKMFATLALTALLFAGLTDAAFAAGGNELMYKPTQFLTTLVPSSVDATADYVPVFDASAGVMKKVLAVGSARSVVPTTVAVDTTLDATYCGKHILMSGAGSSRTFTLPAATGTGCILQFKVSAVNTSNYVISRAGSDTIKGALLYASDNASNAALSFETTGASLVTLNGTTKGGAAVGDFVTLEDIGAAVWIIRGQVTESGSEATPFS